MAITVLLHANSLTTKEIWNKININEKRYEKCGGAEEVIRTEDEKNLKMFQPSPLLKFSPGRYR